MKCIQQVRMLCTALAETGSVLLDNPSFKDVFHDNGGLMPVVLVPEAVACLKCDADLKTDSRPSLVSVYTNEGKETGHSYHKKCAECGLLAYYSYYRNINGKRTFYTTANTKPYFLISSKTAFSDALVKQFAAQIEISFVSFESACNQYFALTGDNLDKQRVEEMYFLNKLINTYSSFSEEVCVENDDSFRKDIELMCKNAIENMVTLSNLEEDHQCDTPGCKEGFIVADGVEKVSALQLSF